MNEEDDAPSQSPSRSQSHPPSPTRQTNSGASPAAPTPHAQRNGRATEPVTIAAPPQHTLTLALPIQHPRPAAAAGGGGGGGVGGREDCWSEGATSALIDAWGERFVELSRGNLKQKHWQEVADAVSSRDDYTKPPKTDVQCKNRIDTLKKKYKLEKSKTSSAAAAAASWPFFHRLEHLIGPTQKPTTTTTNPTPPTSKKTKAAATAAFPIQPPFPQRQRTHHPTQKNNQKKRSPSSSSSSKSGRLRPDSPDSFPPKTAANGRKRQRPFPAPVPEVPPPPVSAKKMRGLRELTKAILRFGEVYERVESSKLHQLAEMEKQRMGFSRELQLQRMEFFVKTQMELSQLNHHYQPAAAGGAGTGGKRKKPIGGSSNNNNVNSNSTNKLV